MQAGGKIWAEWSPVLTKNWSEERQKAYEELHSFLSRRAAGGLEVQRYQQKVNFHHQPVSTSHADAPFVGFGVPIHLDNGATRFAAEMNDAHTFASVSGTSSQTTGWRASFCLQAVPHSQATSPWLSEQRDKGILHYGERVNICTCNDVCMALVVRSLLGSNHQALYFHAQAGADAHWQVLAVDSVNRELLMGLPVANGDLVVLRNCLTGQLLCLEPKVKQTEFGAEHAVTARTALDAIRRKALELVKQGNVLGELGPSIGIENCWKLATASNE